MPRSFGYSEMPTPLQDSQPQRPTSTPSSNGSEKENHRHTNTQLSSSPPPTSASLPRSSPLPTYVTNEQSTFTQTMTSNSTSANEMRSVAPSPSIAPIITDTPTNDSHSDVPTERRLLPVKKDLALAERIINDEAEFNRALFKYMKSIGKPISRVPHLGFKKLNLFTFFRLSLRLGGYQWITMNRNWKRIYDSLGGDQKSTSAATCTRRHYEALLLPFERYVQQLRGKSAEPIKEVAKLQRGRKPKVLIERSQQIERLMQLQLDAPRMLEHLDHNSIDAMAERLYHTGNAGIELPLPIQGEKLGNDAQQSAAAALNNALSTNLPTTVPVTPEVTSTGTLQSLDSRQTAPFNSMLDSAAMAMFCVPRKRGRKPKYVKEMEEQFLFGTRPRIGSFDTSNLAALQRFQAQLHEEAASPVHDRGRSFSFGGLSEDSLRAQLMEHRLAEQRAQQRLMSQVYETTLGSPNRSTNETTPHQAELQFLQQRYYQLEQLQIQQATMLHKERSTGTTALVPLVEEDELTEEASAPVLDLSLKRNSEQLESTETCEQEDPVEIDLNPSNERRSSAFSPPVKRLRENSLLDSATESANGDEALLRFYQQMIAGNVTSGDVGAIPTATDMANPFRMSLLNGLYGNMALSEKAANFASPFSLSSSMNGLNTFSDSQMLNYKQFLPSFRF